ncbi:MAG: hypothetical protein K0S56_2774 [Microvirga sp.]|nr:hypothetical protein [Microvirga sp.]
MVSTDTCPNNTLPIVHAGDGTWESLFARPKNLAVVAENVDRYTANLGQRRLVRTIDNGTSSMPALVTSGPPRSAALRDELPLMIMQILSSMPQIPAIQCEFNHPSERTQ